MSIVPCNTPSSPFVLYLPLWLDQRHGGWLMHSNSCVDGTVPSTGIFHIPTDQTHDQSFGTSVVEQANQVTWSSACRAKWLWGTMLYRNVLGTSLWNFFHSDIFARNWLRFKSTLEKNWDICTRQGDYIHVWKRRLKLKKIYSINRNMTRIASDMPEIMWHVLRSLNTFPATFTKPIKRLLVILLYSPFRLSWCHHS